jgi:hypothetical protein
LPHECCDLGPNKVRGEVFGIVVEQTAISAKQEQEEMYKACVKENCQRLEFEDASSMENAELTTIIAKLLEDRKQLRDIKRKIKSKFGSSSSSLKTEPVDNTFSNLVVPAVPPVTMLKSARNKKINMPTNKKNLKVDTTSPPTPLTTTAKSVESSKYNVTPTPEPKLMYPPRSPPKMSAGDSIANTSTNRASSATSAKNQSSSVQSGSTKPQRRKASTREPSWSKKFIVM